MTYISGQPIVFVGTGQTYTDLKSLNAKVFDFDFFSSNNKWTIRASQAPLPAFSSCNI